MWYEGESGVWPLLVIHIDVTIRTFDGQLRQFSLPFPPAVLQGTTTEHLLAAIQHRIGPHLTALKVRRTADTNFVLILSTDSATQMCRLAYHAATHPIEAIVDVNLEAGVGAMGPAAAELPAAPAPDDRPRHRRDMSLHSRCMVHMFWGALVIMMHLYGIVGPMFCATVLIHKGYTLRNVRKRVRAHIRENLTLAYGPPPPENALFANAVVLLLG